MKRYPVIDFWFEEIPSDMWWKKNDDFDNEIKTRFLDLHTAAVRGELFGDRHDALGCLQEIILLDQFSRNMFRGTANAFANDSLALAISQTALMLGLNKHISEDYKAFLYMPFMHSESLIVHQTSIELFSEPDLHEYLEYEVAHRDLINRFGRFPHRNLPLGRESTEQEKEYVRDNPDF